MRALTPHSNYSIQVIEAQEQILMDARGFAKTVTLKEPVIANFQQGGLLDYEIEFALERFSFSGLPEGVNPLTRIAFFDTEAYVQKYPVRERDEMLVQIDQRLEELQKLYPNEFIIVAPPKAERPWPSYDNMGVEDILKFQEILWVSPTKIRLYELENKNRPEIVLAMLRIEDPDAAEQYAAEQKDVFGGGPDQGQAGGLQEFIQTNVTGEGNHTPPQPGEAISEEHEEGVAEATVSA